MTHHLESLYLIWLVCADAALLARDGQLFLNAVHAVEVGQQQAAPAASCDDDAVASGLKLRGRGDGLGLSQDVHAVFETGQLPGLHGREARVMSAG